MVNNELNSILQMPVRITLPTIYDSALSYLEVISKIAERTEYALDLIKQYENAYKEYTDTELAKAKAEINAKLEKTVTELQKDYTEFETVVNANLTLMRSQISTFDNKLTTEIIGVNARTDEAIASNNKYILEEVAKGFVDLQVINYFTGRSVSVQEMFDYLAQFHLTNAISYAQLVTASKTYTQFKDYGMSYTQLATDGATIIK